MTGWPKNHHINHYQHFHLYLLLQFRFYYYHLSIYYYYFHNIKCILTNRLKKRIHFLYKFKMLKVKIE